MSSSTSDVKDGKRIRKINLRRWTSGGIGRDTLDDEQDCGRLKLQQ